MRFAGRERELALLAKRLAEVRCGGRDALIAMRGRRRVGKSRLVEEFAASEHRKRLRSTNLLERTFVEVRRRTKVIGRFPGETSALTLIWAVLELASRGWRGIAMTPRTVAEIERIRRAQGGSREPPRTDHRAEEVIAA